MTIYYAKSRDLISIKSLNCGKLHGYTVHQTMLKTFSLPTDAHNVKKHRVIKAF